MVMKRSIFKAFCVFFILSFFLSFSVYADSDSLSVNSRAYVVIDRNSNSVLIEKNSNKKRKMASTTKIMTGILVIENSDLSETVSISSKAAHVGGSNLNFKVGDKITVRDLLFAMLLKSANGAAVALAEHVSGSIENFADLMNQKAKNLNLSNTHFENPHGLDSDNHYTTAYELALLANYAMKNSTFAEIVGTKTYTLTLNGYPLTISNTNELLGNFDGVYGIKTGFTNGANRCLVSCCKRGNLDVICVVLGADTKQFRSSDSMKLLNYSFNNFELTDISSIIKKEFESWKLENENDFIVDKGLSKSFSFDVKLTEISVLPLDKNKKSLLNVKIDCCTHLFAPVQANSCIGNAVLMIGDETVLATCPIIATETVPKKNILKYFYEFLKDYTYCINTAFANFS